MAKITTLFVDKDGVLVNNDELGAQYQQLVADANVWVRRQPGEPFEDSVLRAFDRVDEMLA
jgi:hypothetical protein